MNFEPWIVTMLAIHIAAFAGFGLLYQQAPCWMQKTVVGLLTVAMAVFAVAFALALNDMAWEQHLVYRLGLAVEHVAVLLYVFRLHVQGATQWTASSAPSRS